MPRRTFRHAIFAAMVAFGSVVAGSAASAASLADIARAARASTPGIFGSRQIEIPTARALPQWRGVLATLPRETARFRACLTGTAPCAVPGLRPLRAALRGAAARGPRTVLETVNAFFNARPYHDDMAAYGRPEHWATASEFMALGGDCEDYAVAKLVALRALGFAADAMRIVVLRDIYKGRNHAILAVRDGADELVLDNAGAGIHPQHMFRFYHALASFNETRAWTHFRPAPPRNQTQVSQLSVGNTK